MKPSQLLTLSAFACLLFLPMQAQALTREQLRNDATLTPQTFARHFSKFRFVFRADVQKPEEFLAAEAGDCDDYSTLAAEELSARGYHPRLISVRLKNVVHVVCYVAEANGYLDYNKRAKGSGIVSCASSLDAIAESVAKSFKSSWSSASEFTYGNGVKRLVSTTVAGNRMASK
jgi:hypothetical protein